MGPLVSADSLLARLGDDRLVVIDVRLAADGGRSAYEAGHIPGSVYTDYVADSWRTKVGDAPGLLPPLDHLARLLGRLGITPDRHIVLVPSGASANSLAASARIYWTLKTIGHDAISILDGGLLGWMSGSSRPLSRGAREPEGAPPYPVQLRETWRAKAGDVEAALAKADATFVDARAASYFSGREKAPEAAREGRLPGAVSRDYADLFDPARKGLKPSAELERLFRGIPEGRVISYCNTGHTAALAWFVLSELLGRLQVQLYDGSMTEWTQEPTRPVETD